MIKACPAAAAGPKVCGGDRLDVRTWPNGPIIGILQSGIPLTALAFSSTVESLS
jgi:hypothetical protein